MPENVKKDSNYHWTRVNALRMAITTLDKMARSFQVQGRDGSVRSIMAAALLKESLLGAFMQAVETFRPHTEDTSQLADVFKINAEGALKEVLQQAKDHELVISWPDVVGGKTYDPYGAGYGEHKEGEDDG